MQPLNDIVIKQTTDIQVFDICAAKMSASDPWITLGMDYNHCINAFNGPSKEVYVVYCDNKIAGFSILQDSGSFKGYIQTLFVDKDLRGKGIGKKILQFCEKRIQSVSPNIFICVSTFNKDALKLYEAFGFIQVGTLTNFIRNGYDEILLRKTIGPIIGYMPAGKQD